MPLTKLQEKSLGRPRQRLLSTKKESLCDAESLTQPYESSCRRQCDNKSLSNLTIPRRMVIQNSNACMTQYDGTIPGPK